VDGVATIEEAVEACRRFSGTEIEKAVYARSLVARKMAYSRRNPWDSPARCFERGYGYCVQQALALELICHGLGIACVPVQALLCRFPAGIVHGEPVAARLSGHMWLRLRSGGKTFDIDPTDASLPPGILGFEVLSRVTNPPRWLIVLGHVFSAAENARRDLPALLAARRAR
jgi:transglutaminase-like putative cysteine protease